MANRLYILAPVVDASALPATDVTVGKSDLDEIPDEKLKTIQNILIHSVFLTNMKTVSA